MSAVIVKSLLFVSGLQASQKSSATPSLWAPFWMRVMTWAWRRWRTVRTLPSPASAPRTAWRGQWAAASSTSFLCHAAPTSSRRPPSRTSSVPPIRACSPPAGTVYAHPPVAPPLLTKLRTGTRVRRAAWRLLPPPVCCPPCLTWWQSLSACRCWMRWSGSPGSGGAVGAAGGPGSERDSQGTRTRCRLPKSSPAWATCRWAALARTRCSSGAAQSAYGRETRGITWTRGTGGRRRGAARGRRSTCRPRRAWRVGVWGLGGRWSNARSAPGPSRGTTEAEIWAVQVRLAPTNLWIPPILY